MKNKFVPILPGLVLIVETVNSQNVNLSPETLSCKPFVWPSEIPDDCPFKQSGNFAPDWNNENIEVNPPGTHYGMVFQKIELSNK